MTLLSKFVGNNFVINSRDGVTSYPRRPRGEKIKFAAGLLANIQLKSLSKLKLSPDKNEGMIEQAMNLQYN